VIHSGRETWFSFFSSVDDNELIELQDNLFSIFQIMVNGPEFTDF
jgi:hypothetical protein